MRDFKYLELVTNDNWNMHMKSLNEIKSPFLKPLALVFVANLERTQEFAMLPAEMAFQTGRNVLFQLNALFLANGQTNVKFSELPDTVWTPEVARHVGAQIQEFESLGYAKANELRLLFGVKTTVAMSTSNEGMISSMDAMLTSIVLESWLFFEAMCSDLWVAGVDNGGSKIMGRMLSNQSWEKSDKKADVAVKAKASAKTHPGSYWREVGMVSFQKLRSIKGYFEIAFGNDCGKLFESTSGGYINALSAVRNCITHKAGKVDEQFKQAIARFPDLDKFQVDEKYLLDGLTVKWLRLAALETGMALIGHVDGLLQAGK